MDFRKDIKDYIALEIDTLNKLDVDAINDALNLLMETAKMHKRIYICIWQWW